MTPFFLLIDDIGSVMQFAILGGLAAAIFFGLLTFRLLREKKNGRVFISVFVGLLTWILTIGLFVTGIGNL